MRRLCLLAADVNAFQAKELKPLRLETRQTGHGLQGLAK